MTQKEVKDHNISETNLINENNENFIMLPKVDFCFKELMKNDKVRKGFVAAILGKAPEEIRRTTLLPTELRKESEDDKLGILDVMIELEDGTLMNMEMQVAFFKYWINRVLFYIGKIYTGQIREGEDYEKLQKCVHVSILDFNYFQKDNRCYRKAAICDMETGELYTDLLELHTLELRKLPPEAQNEKGIIHWMRFLGGKKREEFEDMAKQDEYIGEAYEELKKLSLDDQKRLEYELRQKAIRDYNSQMKSAREDGRHDALRELIGKKLEKGMSPEDIAELFELELDEVRELAEEWKKEQ